MSQRTCPCDPRCFGPGDTIHNEQRAAINYNASAYPPVYPQAYPYSYQPCSAPPAPYMASELAAGPQLMLDPEHDMLNVVEDVLAHMATNPAVPADQSNRYDGTTRALEAYRDDLLDGAVLAPPEVVAQPVFWMQFSAAYNWVADLLVITQLQFEGEPHPAIVELVRDLNDQAQSLRLNEGFLGPELPPTVVEPAVESATEPAVASSSTHPQRPGPSVLQRSQSDFRSMTHVPSASSATNVTVVGSGTDYIDHFNMGHLDIDGLEAIKLMHPLQQANVAKLQAPFLRKLAVNLAKGQSAGKYSRPGSMPYAAVDQSLDAVLAEILRRRIGVPDVVYAVRAQHEGARDQHGRSMFSVPRQPSFGPRSTGRFPSFGRSQQPGRSMSFLQRQPSFGPRPTARMPTFGPGQQPGRSMSSAKRQQSFGPRSAGRLPSFGPGQQSWRSRSFARREPSFGPSQLPGRSASFAQRAPSFGPRSGARTPGYGPPSRMPSFGARATSRMPSHGPQSAARVPSFGPQSANRLPSFALRGGGRSGSCGPTRSSQQIPTTTGSSGKRPDFTQELQELGSGAEYSEWIRLGRKTEFNLKHPLVADDLDEDMNEFFVKALEAQLDFTNSRVSRRDLQDPEVAKRYSLRSKSLAVLDQWLDAQVVAKNALASGDVAARSVTPEDRESVAKSFIKKTRESGLPSDETQKIADRILTGQVDQLVAEQVNKGKQPASALAVPGADSKSKGKRSVSFHEHEKSGPSSPRLRPGMLSRTSSIGSSRFPSLTGSRSASPARPFLSTRASSGYTAAFPNAARVRTLEAQHKAQQNRIAEITKNVETQSSKVQTTKPAGSSTQDAKTMHEELSRRALAAAETLSNRASAGSDVANLADLLSDDGKPQSGSATPTRASSPIDQFELAPSEQQQAKAGEEPEKDDPTARTPTPFEGPEKHLGEA